MLAGRPGQLERAPGLVALLTLTVGWVSAAAAHPQDRAPEPDPLSDTPASGAYRPDSPLQPTRPGVTEPAESTEDPGPARVRSAEDEVTGLGFAPVAGVTYSSETSVMFGTAAVLFYKPPLLEQRRTSQLTVALAYSLRRQFVGTAYTDLFTFDDRFFLRAAFNFLLYPDSYFGIGNSTSLDDEERYTPRNLEVRLRPLYQILDNVFVGPAFRLESVRITDVQPGGLLDSDSVLGSDGGFDFALGIAASYDTRDSTLYPRRGSSLQYWTLVSDPAFGADFRMSRTLLDLRHYIPTGPKDHVLALQGVGRFTTGDVPFFALGRLGGERLLRGHFNGRYRDKQLLAAQAEYRFPLVWRLGMVAFAGVGEVGERIADLRARALKYSLGGGLRLNVSKKERIHFRGDFGWGGDEHDFYVNVGEAF
jgi:outer membrane protein assembly factor BamA